MKKNRLYLFGALLLLAFAGFSFTAFKDSMTQNRERLDAAESAVEIDPRDVEFFRTLRPLRCVALAEDCLSDLQPN